MLCLSTGISVAISSPDTSRVETRGDTGAYSTEHPKGRTSQNIIEGLGILFLACARTPAACSPPMTEMRALGHMKRKLGL